MGITLWRAKVRFHDIFFFRTFIFKMSTRAKKIGILVKKTTYRHHLERLEKLGLTSDEHWKLYTGTTRENLLYRHERHMQSVSQVQNALLENNCRIFNLKKSVREDNTPLDLAVAIGGDGTFLRAAGWLLNRNLPLIGFNSDPESSQGELCTIRPDQTAEFIQKLRNNEMFKMYRSRVRTQLKGPKTCFKKIRSQVTHDVVTNKDAEIVTKNLPERGLNEVFVGELDATEPSYLEIEINQSGHWQRIKCSGVLISTGTGSTAWSQSVGKITKTEMNELNDALIRLGRNPIWNSNEVLRHMNVSRNYSPADSKLLVTIREPIENRIFSCASTRFFCQNLRVVSRCYSGMVAIDGKYRYTLPAGAEAFFDSDGASQLCTYPTLVENEQIALRNILQA